MHCLKFHVSIFMISLNESKGLKSFSHGYVLHSHVRKCLASLSKKEKKRHNCTMPPTIIIVLCECLLFQTNWHFDHNGSSLGLFTLRSCLSSQANRDPLFQNHTVFYGLTSMIWAKKENCCGHETLRNNVLRFSNWRSF